jgi:hypothetical protein
MQLVVVENMRCSDEIRRELEHEEEECGEVDQ